MNTETKTWTEEAETYLQGYLHQVEALLAGQGADAKEVIADLRSHIIQMAETQAGALVTVPDVKRMLGTLGTAEDVANSWGELGKEVAEEDPWAAPYLNPPEEKPRRPFPVLWIAGGLIACVGIVLLALPIVWIVLRITVSSEAASRSHATVPVSTSAPTVPQNLVEPNETRGALLNGWFQAGNNHADYITGTASSVAGIKESAMFIRSMAPQPAGFSTVMREVSAENYRGGKVTLTGKIAAANVAGRAGLWLRIDGPNQEPLGFDDMQDHAIVGTREATSYTITLDVPSNAESFAYGVLLEGPGTVWFSEPHFTPDKHAAAIDRKSPGMYTEAFLESHDAEYFFQRMAQPDPGYHQFAGLWAVTIKADRASEEEREAIIGRAIGLAQNASNPFQQRFQCCYVVSSIEDPRTVPYLESLLQTESDAKLRGVIACALGHYETSEAVRALRQALSYERDPEVRSWIERALAGEFPRPKLPEPGSGPEG